MKGLRGTDDIKRHEESPDGAVLPSEMSLDSILSGRVIKPSSHVS